MLKEVAPRLTRVKNDGGERCGKSERGSHSRRELLDVGLRGDRLRRRKQDHQLNQRSQIRASTGARSSSRSPRVSSSAGGFLLAGPSRTESRKRTLNEALTPEVLATSTV